MFNSILIVKIILIEYSLFDMQVNLPLIAFPATAELIPEPLGLVYIISSWNFPFGNC